MAEVYRHRGLCIGMAMVRFFDPGAADRAYHTKNGERMYGVPLSIIPDATGDIGKKLVKEAITVLENSAFSSSAVAPIPSGPSPQTITPRPADTRVPAQPNAAPSHDSKPPAAASPFGVSPRPRDSKGELDRHKGNYFI